jgi:RNA polymerase sigma factor (sigma-70 family)
MTKPEFDNWCNKNLEALKAKLIKEYPKVKDNIDNDTIEFYTHVLDRLDSIKQPSHYYYAWVYNRNFRYHKKHKYTEHIDISEIPELPEETDPLQQYREKLDLLLEQLPLDDKILYDWYYVQELSTRKIATMLGITHVGVHKQIKRMQQKLKEKLCSD